MRWTGHDSQAMLCTAQHTPLSPGHEAGEPMETRVLLGNCPIKYGGGCGGP